MSNLIVSYHLKNINFTSFLISSETFSLIESFLKATCKIGLFSGINIIKDLNLVVNEEIYTYLLYFFRISIIPLFEFRTTFGLNKPSEKN